MNEPLQSSLDHDRARGASRLPRFLTTTHGAVMVCLVAVLLAAVGLLMPLLMTEMRRQALIAEISKDNIGFDPEPRSRWGLIGPLLPKRFHGVNALLVGDDPTSDLTGFDFRRLQYFPELTELGVLGHVTEDQLLALPPLDNLEKLWLRNARCSDAVVRHTVQTYPQLTTLSLENGPTDASIEEICRLKNLRLLSLGETKISVRALRELKSLEHLETLYLADTKVLSAAERKELLEILPIEWTGPAILDPEPDERETHSGY